MEKKVMILAVMVGVILWASSLQATDTAVVLDDAAGSSAFSVKDSGSTEVAHIDSDGNMVIKGGLRLDASGVEYTTAENLIVDGNVGIGTTVPQAKLDLSGGYTSSGLSGSSHLAFGASGASPDAGQLIWGDNTGWKLHFGTQASGTFTPRMTIVDTGNVGIGTTSPTAKLHIGGTAGTDGIKFPDGSLQTRAAKLINSYFAITAATRQDLASTTPGPVTGLAITLTPASTSSKFLIKAIVNGSNTHVCSPLIYRNGSPLLTHAGNTNESGAQATLYLGTSSTDWMDQMVIDYLDSPGTAAAITYDVRVTSGWAGTPYSTYVNDRASNDMRTPSTLTILEFAN